MAALITLSLTGCGRHARKRGSLESLEDVVRPPIDLRIGRPNVKLRLGRLSEEVVSVAAQLAAVLPYHRDVLQSESRVVEVVAAEQLRIAALDPVSNFSRVRIAVAEDCACPVVLEADAAPQHLRQFAVLLACKPYRTAPDMAPGEAVRAAVQDAYADRVIDHDYVRVLAVAALRE